jgi:hypothetical protein
VGASRSSPSDWTRLALCLLESYDRRDKRCRHCRWELLILLFATCLGEASLLRRFVCKPIYDIRTVGNLRLARPGSTYHFGW